MNNLQSITHHEACEINGGAADPNCGCTETGRDYAKRLKKWWNDLDLNPFD